MVGTLGGSDGGRFARTGAGSGTRFCGDEAIFFLGKMRTRSEGTSETMLN